jgi:hypothetical protein
MPLTRLKIALFAPMPSASDSTITRHTPGRLPNIRKAKRRS